MANRDTPSRSRAVESVMSKHAQRAALESYVTRYLLNGGTIRRLPMSPARPRSLRITRTLYTVQWLGRRPQVTVS